MATSLQDRAQATGRALERCHNHMEAVRALDRALDGLYVHDGSVTWQMELVDLPNLDAAQPCDIAWAQDFHDY